MKYFRIHKRYHRYRWCGGQYLWMMYYAEHITVIRIKYVMTSSNGSIFCVTGPLWREFTGHRWIPITKASDAELWCFLWSAHWTNGWINNREAGDLGRHRAHYDVIVVISWKWKTPLVHINNILIVSPAILLIFHKVQNFGVVEQVQLSAVYKWFFSTTWTVCKMK